MGAKILPLPGLGYQIEKTLYSDLLGYAGTVDFIAEIDHINTLVDWKTSSSPTVG